MAKILFVAFHGLVCLVDGGNKNGDDRGFKAYVLLDKDKVHKQMYGDFLAEQDFAPAPGGDFPVNLTFSNELQAGNDSLNGNLNPVVLQLTDFPSATKQNAVAVITLPRPKQIHHAFSGRVSAGTLVGNDLGRLNPLPSRISEVRIFEYNFNNEANVNVSDDSGKVVWQCPSLATVGNDNIAVFHVYDEPPLTIQPQASTDAHNVQEFKDSMDFLGVDVQITAPAKPIDAGSLKPPRKGILDSEIAPLDQRHDILIKFIRAFRSGDRIPLGGAGGTQVCGGANGLVG